MSKNPKLASLTSGAIRSILLVCLFSTLTAWQQGDEEEIKPLHMNLEATTIDKAVKKVVKRVSEEQYKTYQVAIESMGLGLYGGKEYDMGFRNRNFDSEKLSPSLGNQEACKYIQDKFKEMGLSVSEQGKYINVIGELKGTTTPEKIYIICAHYDHVEGDMPGGDDNASGTAAVLEAARILSQYQFESTIRFVCFNAEENGLKGSRDYVDNHVLSNEENIVGVINMDAILRPGSDAKPDRPIDVELETNGSLPWVRAYVQAMANYVPSLIPGDIWEGAASSSDNDAFQEKGISALLTIENSDGDWSPPNPVANPYMHDKEDASDRRANNPEAPNEAKYDYTFATDITRTTVALIAQEAKLKK